MRAFYTLLESLLAEMGKKHFSECDDELARILDRKWIFW